MAGATTSFQLSGTQLSGTATATIKTTFLAIAGHSTITVTARGAAIRTTTTTSSGALPCIFALATNTSQALLINSGAKINAPDCEVHVRSTASPAAIFNAGTTLNLKTFCIQGTNIIKNTSVAFTIAVVELMAATRSMQETTFQIFEAFTAATLIYLAVNLLVVRLMNGIERKLEVPGLSIRQAS